MTMCSMKDSFFYDKSTERYHALQFYGEFLHFWAYCISFCDTQLYSSVSQLSRRSRLLCSVNPTVHYLPNTKQQVDKQLSMLFVC